MAELSRSLARPEEHPGGGHQNSSAHYNRVHQPNEPYSHHHSHNYNYVWFPTLTHPHHSDTIITLTSFYLLCILQVYVIKQQYFNTNDPVTGDNLSCTTGWVRGQRSSNNQTLLPTSRRNKESIPLQVLGGSFAPLLGSLLPWRVRTQERGPRDILPQKPQGTKP